MFPWQQKQWQTLLQCYQQKRLPHALLFSGIAGIGKKKFAEALAEVILCRQPSDEGRPCGQCHACHLMKAKTHSDYVFVEPEQDSRIIKIDQIREMIHFANETALQNGYKIIVIDPANAMNIAAANALLKTLEEPTPNTLLILITDQSARLPATITSRCQKITFQKPARETALRWLAENGVSDKSLELVLNLAEGAPLKAKELVENNTLQLRNEFYQGLAALSKKAANPLQLAAQWYEQDARLLLNLLLSWLRDVMRCTVAKNTEIINFDFKNELLNLTLPRKKLLIYLDKVQQAYARIINSLNLNKQLMLEELLIEWYEL